MEFHSSVFKGCSKISCGLTLCVMNGLIATAALLPKAAFRFSMSIVTAPTSENGSEISSTASTVIIAFFSSDNREGNSSDEEK